MVFTNCVITGGDALVLRECVMSNTDPLYREYKGYHTGVDLATERVYSLYSGTVVDIGQGSEGQSVVIQTGSSLCICYRWLRATTIQVGQDINEKTYLGIVNKYVHVESYEKSKSAWPVRLGNNEWYKSDITNILKNGYIASVTKDDVKFYSDLNVKEISDYCGGYRNKIVKSVIEYHSDNRGKDEK